MTLSLYIARRFLAAVAAIFAIFLVLMMLIDMVEQLRRFAGGKVGFSQAAELAALNVPTSVYRILPLIVMLATIALFIGLSRSSELVVVRAAGRSALRAVLAPLSAAFLLGAFAVAVLNPLVAATSKEYDTLRAHYTATADSVLSISREGLWLRQGGPEGQTVIRAERSGAEATELYNVTVFAFDADGRLMMRIEADEAQLVPGAWQLREAKVWHFEGSDNPERDAIHAATYRLPSDLTRDQIRDSFGAPSAISIWALPGFIARLEAAGFSARTHRVWLQTEMALPLLLAAMVLVGAGFTMRHVRAGRTGLMVLLAILSGFSIFFLRNFAQVLGETGQIPVALAAWSPPFAAILLALGLLLHLEDG